MVDRVGLACLAAGAGLPSRLGFSLSSGFRLACSKCAQAAFTCPFCNVKHMRHMHACVTPCLASTLVAKRRYQKLRRAANKVLTMKIRDANLESHRVPPDYAKPLAP